MNVENIQKCISDLGAEDSLLEQKDIAQSELAKALIAEEILWKEKARLNWHLYGDRNTSFFHKNDTSPNNLIHDVVPSLVTDDDNEMVTKMPSNDEIKSAVFAMNGDGAPGPDGFSGCFYQHFWDIVHHEVCSSVNQFFTHGWILTNLNSNSVVLIPKTEGADKLEDFRPITLANFQFKIITKVLADRLASIATKIISPQQRGFIKERKIQDCICIASEAINLLEHKAFGGNLAIKLDIKKAFDTMDWTFLLDTLKAFGFNHKFCNWIKAILHSARLSILINGHSADVLSRGISKLRLDNRLSTISGPKSIHTTSHVLYADDILIFCKGVKMELMSLKKLVMVYAQASGQEINIAKCKFYAGNFSARKKDLIASWLGFHAGSIPFNYLGVPLFKGRPKRIHLQPIADRILKKNVILERVLSIYYGHVDKGIRNFIWAGDIKKRKIVTVAWSKVCSPILDGGLGLRSVKLMNKASLLKLAWEMRTSSQEWALLFRDRFGYQHSPATRHFRSSIWSRIKENWHACNSNSIWLIGAGHQINFWKDNWLGEPLVELMNIPQELHSSLLSSVACFRQGNSWTIPSFMNRFFPNIIEKIAKTTIAGNLDRLVWKKTLDGTLSLKGAYNEMPTDDNLRKRGCAIVSICNLCNSHSEKEDHLFLHCTFASSLWDWINHVFSINLNNSSLKNILDDCAKMLNKQVKEAIRRIKRDTSLVGNSSSASASPNVEDLLILRSFNINDKFNLAPRITEVTWLPRERGWIKVNTDGAAHDSPGHSGGGGIFRDHNGVYITAFSKYLTIQNAIFVEFHAALHAVQIAYNRGWKQLWIEVDSSMLLDIFSGKSNPPWSL
ncbi:PREDICTED: uncharacterized protein LOC109334024 [Lupinus angustifolius]|uniref:uncharacterized protein LOC109334024 n=1 Tax=Lupinus angustifolius TaxID=3871 RepID=UPI00092EB623|nr:PREDICTED: uncharacterized protein LOC109334024 [Lupinus angustifolius]